MTESKTATTCTATSTDAYVAQKKTATSSSRVRSQADSGGTREDVPYVELLARSHFSFLQGASFPEEMVLHAQALGYRGIAICDLNGLYGVVRGFQAIEYPSHFSVPISQSANSFQYHCGAEMQMLDLGEDSDSSPAQLTSVDGVFNSESNFAGDSKPSTSANGSSLKKTKSTSIAATTRPPARSSANSIALLPMNKDGYTNLCQIITESKRSSQKGFSQLSLDFLSLYNDDLIAFAIPPWKLPQLQRLQEIFDDRLYLPVWKDLSWESLEIYHQALKLEEQGFELFATQRPFMHAAERKPIHDVLTCILHRTTLKKAKTRLLANGERHLKPLAELKELWRDRPDLLGKTVNIAKRLKFSLHELRYEYPQAARPPGKEASEYLRELTESGIQKRFPNGVPAEVRATIEHELQLISEMQYEDYFLTLWDVCQFAVRQGILHQGRGSAANSVVCYALGLTAVDPTKVKLLFERFISKERGEPPDIDIDFESGRREEVIQYIYQKYGAAHAAMVCTVICYRGRMALRECAKVLEIPTTTVDKMIRYMGREGPERLRAAPEKAREWGIEERTYQLLLRLIDGIKGFPRHLGIHTGGFLIAKRPITECVPVEKATMDQRYVIQWNKDDLTVLKMLKIDVLGLGMMTALQKSFELLKSYKNIDMELITIPPDDKATYLMTQKADTVGVFQIESRAQMSLLPRLRPSCFYDLVIEVAIVRPGPIQGGMVHPFIRRRHGFEPITYAHPALKPILEKTCGVPIFQEQIMQIAAAVCGFTPGEADELRRIMSSSWKKAELMHNLRQRLINGMLNHGIELAYAEQIYQTIVGFSSYGFPESHAASFALLTYASCYLKWHHPEIFVASLLNAQPMGFYSPRALIADAQRHGVQFLPLDIQTSDYDYKLEPQSLVDSKRHLALVSFSKKESNSLNSQNSVQTEFHEADAYKNSVQTEFHDADAHKNPVRTGLDENSVRTENATKFSVRVGFRAVRGLKEVDIQKIVTERKTHGPFRDLEDLIRRTRLSKNVLLRIAASGALEFLGLRARQAMWTIQGLNFDPQSLFFARTLDSLADKSAQTDLEGGVPSPIGLTPLTDNVTDILTSSSNPMSVSTFTSTSTFTGAPGEANTVKNQDGHMLPPENDWQKLEREYGTQGYSLVHHPVGLLRPALDRWSAWEQRRGSIGFSKSTQLPHLQNGKPVRVAGLLSLQQRPPTAKGFAFLTLEDETGSLNIVLVPDVYQRYRMVMLDNPLLHIMGKLEKVEGVINIKAQWVKGLPVEKMLNSLPAQLPPAYDFSRCLDDHTV